MMSTNKTIHQPTEPNDNLNIDAMAGSDIPPINRLPEHILSDIFLIAIHPFDLPCDPPIPFEDSDSPLTAFPQLKNDEQPCTLTYVCKAWRRLAFRTPELWSRFHFKAFWGYSSTQSQRESEEILKQEYILAAWLKLSKNMPLSILISFDCPKATGGYSSYISDRLLRAIARWQVLKIDIDERIFQVATDSLTPLFDSLNAGRAANLRYLDFFSAIVSGHTDPRYAEEFDDNEESPFKFSLDSLPNIKHIRVPQWYRIVTQENYTQLESVDIRGQINITGLLGIFDSQPHLVSFRANATFAPLEDESDETPGGVIIRSSLHHLCLTGVPLGIHNTLRHFQLPSLKSLSLFLIPFFNRHTLSNTISLFKTIRTLLEHGDILLTKFIYDAPFYELIPSIKLLHRFVAPRLKNLTIRSEDYDNGKCGGDERFVNQLDRIMRNYQGESTNLETFSVEIRDWSGSSLSRRLVTSMCSVWGNTPPRAIFLELGKPENGEFLLEDQDFQRIVRGGTIVKINGLQVVYDSDGEKLKMITV